MLTQLRFSIKNLKNNLLQAAVDKQMPTAKKDQQKAYAKYGISTLKEIASTRLFTPKRRRILAGICKSLELSHYNRLISCIGNTKP